jgi:hypothetical protein
VRRDLTALALCGALYALPAPALAQHGMHGPHTQHAASDSGALVMGAMTVHADRERILLRSGRTIIDPQAIAATTGSIADLLRAIPGVELDADGNVTMRGNAHALVLINGRRTALTGAALVAYLRQMPAQTLQRIEAATAPSAAQDANGAAGVLNLVFRDADDAERTTPLRSITGTFTSPNDHMATAAATGHAGHAVHWDAAYSMSASRPNTRSEHSRWTALPGDLPFTTDEEVRAVATHRLHSVIAGGAVTPTPATSFGLRGTYSWMRGATSSRRTAAYRDEAGNTAASLTASEVEHVMPSGEVIGTARVERGRVRFASEVRANLVRGEYRGAYDDAGAGFRYRTAEMRSQQREHVLRNDVRVRWPGVDLEFGAESRWRRATAVHDAVHLSAADTREFRHEASVHAGHVSALRSAGAFRGEVGVRVERERDVAVLDSIRARGAVRMFPNVSGEWMDAERGLVYRVAYGRRVTRPGWELLNPLGMGDAEFGEVVGNQWLRAEVVDQVEMGVERRGERTVVLVTPFVRWSEDPIRAISTPTSRGVSSAPENLRWARSAGADVGLRARPMDRVDVTLAGTIANVEVASAALRREGLQAALRAALDVRVSEQRIAQLLLAGRSRRTVEQGDALPEATAQFALRQMLARGRGHVTLQLRGPWRVDRHVRGELGAFSDRVRQFSSQPEAGIVVSFGVGGAARQHARPGGTGSPRDG